VAIEHRCPSDSRTHRVTGWWGRRPLGQGAHQQPLNPGSQGAGLLPLARRGALLAGPEHGAAPPQACSPVRPPATFELRLQRSQSQRTPGGAKAFRRRPEFDAADYVTMPAWSRREPRMPPSTHQTSNVESTYRATSTGVKPVRQSAGLTLGKGIKTRDRRHFRIKPACAHCRESAPPHLERTTIEGEQ